MNDAIHLLHTAKRLGYAITVDDDKLQLMIPEHCDPDLHLLEEIRKHKKHIVDVLKSEDWQPGETGAGEELTLLAAEGGSGDAPLSFGQERLWLIDQLEGSVAYHIPAILRLQGELDEFALESAFRAIVRRHEALRTVICPEGGDPRQKVIDAEAWKMTVEDVPCLCDDPGGLRTSVEELVSRPFDLARDHPLRVHLMRIAESEYILVVVMHHIASDAWTVPILIKELIELYNSRVEGRRACLPPVTVQYRHFAHWQRRSLNPGKMEARAAYWKEKLKGVSPLSIPADIDTPVPITTGGRVSITVGRDLAAKLATIANREECTLFMVLLSGLKILLYNYTGAEDVPVISSIAGRQLAETEGMVGFFANTLIFRSNLKGSMSLRQLMREVKETTLKAYEYQDIPFDKQVELSGVQKRTAGNSVFPMMFVLENIQDAEKFHMNGLRIRTEEFGQIKPKFDLTIAVSQTSSGLNISVTYREGLYSKGMMERMLRHYETILGSMTSLSATERIGRLRLLSREEESLLLKLAGRRAPEPCGKVTVLHLIGKQMRSRPDAMALVSGSRRMSYGEMEDQSVRLGRYLADRGVKRGDLVLLCMDKTIEALAAILAIWRCGAAYVPVDPALPAARILYLLEDTSSRLVLAGEEETRRLAGILSGNGGEGWVSVVDITRVEYTAPFGDSPVEVAPDDAAYVIYTSGSTGRPKGVIVEHGSLSDYVAGLLEEIEPHGCRSFASVSTLAADLGNTVIYASLVAGGMLHLIPSGVAQDAALMEQYFRENSIDCLKIVPSHWKAVSYASGLLLPLKLIIFGGDSLNGEIVDTIRTSHRACRILNHYGPTETTIGKLMHLVAEDEQTGRAVVLGRPFTGSRAYILNRDMALCPIGIPGELYIAGPGVARGYLNQPELTAEKFIDDLFDEEAGTSKMYATGDLCRWTEAGEVAFIGRKDHQVKIRGYRVELPEVENIMKSSGLVREAIVCPFEDQYGDKYLVAYIQPDGTYHGKGLEEFCRSRLPDHMVPGRFVEMDTFPLTANGKVDRTALPEPGTSRPVEKYTAPGTGVEKSLAFIWRELFGREGVGIDDDFFSLGGHSLLAVKMVSEIKRSIFRHISIGDVFEYPTIRSLAERIIERRLAISRTESCVDQHIVLLGAAGDAPPVFIVPGSGGMSDDFWQLTNALEARYTVYGINMQGTESDEVPLSSIEEIAAVQNKWIKSIQPGGPYRLVGYCYGTNIAYEMARQLEAEGLPVSWVSLLDGSAGIGRADMPTDDGFDPILRLMLDYFQSFHILSPPYPEWVMGLRGELTGLPLTGITDRVCQLIQPRLPGKEEVVRFLCRLVNLRVHNALIRYRPGGEISGELLVFRAMDGDWEQEDELLGWGSRSKNVKLFYLPGDHGAIANGENSKAIANFLF
ncbi:MAG TPA: amino acid adenylation domain-containing protein [Puia sp.]|uniref:non-ribosomal peptide synthetase n=1 Tax=Puia sp. TaxID=2045100 RepID=UPI002B5B0F27|nr:amino acid adenylation domain-containing protein [Puia sp.]HVU96082.1 amino acid adenylation domain-containing protein [Puia sp.]